jgi:hypothetical protein
MQRYYIIKNASGMYWDNTTQCWLECATFYTQHGRDTMTLPVGGLWVFAVEM